jgi:hypothetical protein
MFGTADANISFKHRNINSMQQLILPFALTLSIVSGN